MSVEQSGQLGIEGSLFLNGVKVSKCHANQFQNVQHPGWSNLVQDDKFCNSPNNSRCRSYERSDGVLLDVLELLHAT